MHRAFVKYQMMTGVLFLGASAYAQDSPAQSPTISETTGFIKQSMEGPSFLIGARSEDLGDGCLLSIREFVSYDEIASDGCNLTIKRTLTTRGRIVGRCRKSLESRNMNDVDTATFNFSLGNVLPEVEKNIITQVLENVFSFTIVFNRPIVVGGDKRDRWTLYFTSETSASRAAKAFVYGAKLCGSKASPF
jgi:hypothetical protein